MKPIIFSTEMVQAILGGRKTQTRRVIKAPVLDAVREPDTVAAHGDHWRFDWHGDDVSGGFEVRSPYGRGCILWVRETWSKDVNGDYVYRANYGSTEDDSFPPSLFKWRPSIHMPKAAARIWLEVTDVRAERLHGMTEEDAQAEGFVVNIRHFKTLEGNVYNGSTTARAEFGSYWDRLNDKRGYGWSTNPWVWVIEFKAVETHEQKTNIEC